MKAKEVLFDNLAGKTLFIKAKLLKKYHVYQKTGPRTAKIYGSDKIERFCGTEGVIVVTETSFGELLIEHQFVFPADTQKVSGFVPAKEVHVKSGLYHASFIDSSGPVSRVNIPLSTKVLSLAHTFNFRREIVAELNI